MQQHVLPKADHVLEFVNERARDALLDIGAGVRAAQRAAGVRHDRVEHLAIVVAGAHGGIEVGRVEESRHVP